MANETHVTVRGFVAGAPTVYPGQEGRNSTVIRMGVTPSSWNRERGEYRDGETLWYSVRCYGSLARNVAICVDKGMPLLVRGRLNQRRWNDKGGINRSDLVITADSIGVDLGRGTVTYTKVRHDHVVPETEGGKDEIEKNEESLADLYVDMTDDSEENKEEQEGFFPPEMWDAQLVLSHAKA